MTHEYWTRYGSNKSSSSWDENCGHEHRTAVGAARCSASNLAYPADTVGKYRNNQGAHYYAGQTGRIETLLGGGQPDPQRKVRDAPGQEVRFPFRDRR